MYADPERDHVTTHAPRVATPMYKVMTDHITLVHFLPSLNPSTYYTCSILIPMIMAPKHSLETPQAEQRRTKCMNSRSASDPRSAAPVGIAFSVQYMPTDVKGRTSKKQKSLVSLELQVSPFMSNRASSDGELDQYYTVTINADWESIKSYKNFISK